MIELKNGVQIPESSIVQQITAALDGFYAPDTLGLVQYDDTMPVVAVQLTVNNQPYTPGESAELNYRMGKPWPDTHAVYNPCLGVDEEGVIYFSITAQCTTTPGKTTLTVEVTDGGVKNSAPIQVVIAKNPAPKDTIESTDEFLTMQEILAKVQALEKTTTAAATSAAADKVAAQSARKGAEDAEARVQAIVAGNESYTKQETHDRFALALQGTADPAASITIYPDAGSNVVVTAHGFTVQEGSGDASPVNQRPIVNSGRKLVKVVLTGNESVQKHSSGWIIVTLSPGLPEFNTTNPYYFCSIANQSESSWGDGIYMAASTLFIFGVAFVNNMKWGTADEVKRLIKARYDSGNPVILYYAPSDETKATGLYASISAKGEGHTSAGGELTATLCQGDTLITKVKSGCDMELVLTGTENWQCQSAGANSRFYVDVSVAGVISWTGTLSTDWVNARIDPGTTVDGISVYGGTLYLRDASYNGDIEALKSELATRYAAGNPVIVWYRSTNYTPADDIQVSLETHVQWAANVFDVTRSWVLREDLTPNLFIGAISPQPKNAVCVCDTYKGVFTDWVRIQDNQIQVLNDGSYIGIKDSRYSTADELEQALESAPVTIVYELATPITYAHKPVEFIASPGEDGAWVITGEANGKVSAVFNKNITHTIAELQAALLAVSAKLSL